MTDTAIAIDERRAGMDKVWSANASFLLLNWLPCSAQAPIQRPFPTQLDFPPILVFDLGALTGFVAL